MTLGSPKLKKKLSIIFALLTVALTAGTYAAACAHVTLGEHSTLQTILLLLFAALLFAALSLFALRALTAEQDAERPRWFWPVLAGVLTLCVTMISYFFAGMWPFGENTCVMIDMYSQYMPLLAYFRKAILGQGANLLYSTEMGFGISMLPTIGYYLASPLNLISILFPQDYLAECFLTLIAIKTVLSAVTFAACMQYLTGRRSPISAICALLYATSMYFVAYSWNFMWFDVVMLLPLAVLFLEQLLREGKFLPYTLTLGYTLFANFYAAYMLCLFLGLYFFLWCIREKCGGRRFFSRLWRFALCSLLGALLSCVLVIPTYLGLQLTSAAGETIPSLETNFAPWELLARQFFGVIPTELHVSDLPNIACGILPLLVLPLYATTGRIPLRRRLCYLGLFLFLALSMILNIPNFIWHGFHGPNGLPYRYAFLYVFTLLLMTGDLLSHLEALRPRQLLLSLIGLLSYVVILSQVSTEEIPLFSILVTAALLLLYSVVLLLAANRTLRTGAVVGLLFFAVTAECVYSTNETRGELLNEGFSTKHDSYLVSDSHQLLGDLGDEIVRLSEEEGLLFYRADTSNRFTNMDGVLYGYNGINIFASTYYDTTTQLARHLGFSCNTVNSHRLLGFIPTLDSLFGVRYYSSPYDLSGEPGLVLLGDFSRGDETYHLYRNEYALSLGFAGTTALKSWTSPLKNPVLAQNTLYAALTGDSRPLLSLNTDAISTSGPDTVVTIGEQGVGYSFVGGDTPGEITLTITNPGPVYLYVDRNSSFDMEVDGVVRQMDQTSQNTFLNCGVRQAGDTLKIRITSDDKASGTIYAATLNEDVYLDAMETLTQYGLKLDSYSHTALSGTVTAQSDGVFLTTMSYDKGWSVQVDGKDVETYGVDGGLLAFDLTAGTHTISMHFFPSGLKIGGLLTLTGCASILLLLRRRRTLWALDMTSAAPFGLSYDALPRHKPEPEAPAEVLEALDSLLTGEMEPPEGAGLEEPETDERADLGLEKPETPELPEDEEDLP